MHWPALQCDTNYSPPVALSLLLTLTALTTAVVTDSHFRVVRNIDLFERELLRYGNNAIRLQYCNIRYNSMYRAITKSVIHHASAHAVLWGTECYSACACMVNRVLH